MESVFLACFIFGALFTVTSVVLGLAGSGLHELHWGHFGHAGLGNGTGHAGHGGGAAHMPHGHHLGDLGQAAKGGPGSHAPGSSHVQAGSRADLDQAVGIHHGLPLLNASSILAFLTWFGAAGYLLTSIGGWPLWGAVPAAALAGVAGAVIIAVFLAKVLAGEREMDPREYRLEGTLARVTSGIPAGGTGEIVFSKAGVRRSEAARNLGARPLARGTEVVILDYERGVATVQAWDELVGRPAIDSAEAGSSLPAGDHGRESHA